MANTAYTDKQLAEHLERLSNEGVMPENAVLDFRADPILRKKTPEEMKSGRIIRRPAYVRPDRTAADTTTTGTEG